MKLYFAGTEPGYHRELLQGSGVKNYLGSFFYLKEFPYRKEDDFLLDSGGYTARKSGKPINIKDYIDFINTHNISYAFNLDTNDTSETKSNLKVLEEETNAYILPIFHCSDFLDKKDIKLLDEFVEKYPYISTGGVAGVSVPRSTVRNFLDYTFSKTRDKVKVHGLGMTSDWQMERYPFYSVDSTSWNQIQRWGCSASMNNGGSMPNAWTHMGTKEENKKNTEYILKKDIIHYINKEKYYTELWQKRNINWVG